MNKASLSGIPTQIQAKEQAIRNLQLRLQEYNTYLLELDSMLICMYDKRATLSRRALDNRQDIDGSMLLQSRINLAGERICKILERSDMIRCQIEDSEVQICVINADVDVMRYMMADRR